jgi:hypothetical protein
MTIFIVIIIDYYTYYPMIINNKKVSVTIQRVYHLMIVKLRNVECGQCLDG